MNILLAILLAAFFSIPNAFTEEKNVEGKTPPSGFENRCGWLHNPTPANWWLTDKDGEWVIGAQGGYQVSDESYDHLPVFPKNGWKMTNGSYGYGCACLMVKVDRKEKRVMEIKSGRALAPAKCRADKSLKSGDR